MKHDIEKIRSDIEAALTEASDAALHIAVEGVHPADIADVFGVLDDDDRSRLIFMMPARLAAEVVAELDEADRSEVVEELDEQAFRNC